MREFVPDALAAGLDFSGLQRVNPKFHLGRRSARRREGDVIWRLPTREGADIYLYLLMEFQSKSEWWMAVRAQVYEGLLWQQVIDEKKLKAGARLPPLLLLVLYNGLRRWDAPIETHELVALSPDSTLWRWQPQARYYLVDIGAFPRDELARHANLAALLFRLEQEHLPGELEELVPEVFGWFRGHEGYGGLREVFIELVRAAVADLGVKVSISQEWEEEWQDMRSNLMRLGETWKRHYRAEGKAEGLAEGEVKGKAEALLCLLVERFGAVAPPWHERILGAELATLDRWFKRAIVARDLSSVFEPPR